MHAADLVPDGVIETQGNGAAKDPVAIAKVALPRAATSVIDRAVQVHLGAGVTGDTPLPAIYGRHRAMRLFGGPDAVYARTIIKSELRRTSALSLSTGSTA
jgi:acyl-CoA dehydrogenase